MFLMHGFHTGWMLLGGALPLTFWIAQIALVALAIRMLTHANWGRATQTVDLAPDQALEILRERYARGRTMTDQYGTVRHDLMS